MTSTRNSLLAVVASVFAASFLLVNFEQDLSAQQQQNPDGRPRFQISAWGPADCKGSGSTHGVYIVDTHTGQLWHKEGRFPFKNFGNVNEN